MKAEFNKDFIGIFNNSIDSDTLNELLEWFNIIIESGYSRRVYGIGDEYVENNENPDILRRSSYNPMSRNDVAVQWPSNFVDASQLNLVLVKKYQRLIQKCFTKYIENYGLEFHVNLGVLGFKMQKTLPSQGYHTWHFESSSLDSVKRVVTFMTYLKIPEEGGETEFLYQSIRINPVVGRTLLWPAGYTHFHRGNPPLKGDKIYITGWVEMLDSVDRKR